MTPRNPELYGGLPKDPRIPWTVKLWKGPLKWLGNLAMVGGVIGLFAHYLRFGPKSRDPEDMNPYNQGGTKAVSHQEQILPHGHVLRYNFRERLAHWVAAFSYIYLLMTGLAFWSPWLFWVAVILGGAPVSRMLHPWVGLIFFVSASANVRDVGVADAFHSDVDNAWFRAVGHYARNQDDKMPPAGRYNAGQKLLFWGFFWIRHPLFLTGLVLWFPEFIAWSLRWLRYIAILVHASAPSSPSASS